MSKFKLSQLALATTVALTVSACGSESESPVEETPVVVVPPVVVPPVVEPDSTVAISGSAVKGVLINAVVVITDAEGNIIAETITDENGDYSANIPADFKGVVSVQVSATNDTTMVCDTNNCADDIGFGDTITDIAGLTLSSVAYIDAAELADEDDTSVKVSIPVNTLTTLTANTLTNSVALADINDAGENAFKAVSLAATKQVGLALGLSEENIPANFLTVALLDPTVISDLPADEAAEVTTMQIQLSLYNAVVFETIVEQAAGGTADLGSLFTSSMATLSTSIESNNSTELNLFLNQATDNLEGLASNPLLQQEFTILANNLDETVELDIGVEILDSVDFVEEEIDEEALVEAIELSEDISDIVEASDGELSDEDIAIIEDIVDELVPTPTPDPLIAKRATAVNVSNDWLNADGLSVEVNKQIIKATADIRAAIQYALTNGSLVDLDATGGEESEVIAYTINGGKNDGDIRYIYIQENVDGSGVTATVNGSATSSYFSGVITDFPITKENADSVDCNLNSQGDITGCVGADGTTAITSDQTAILFAVGYGFNGNPGEGDPSIISKLAFKGIAGTEDAIVTFGESLDAMPSTATLKSYNPTLNYTDIGVSVDDSQWNVVLPNVGVYTGDWNKKLSGSATIDFEQNDQFLVNTLGANILKIAKATINTDYVAGSTKDVYGITTTAYIYKQDNKKLISKTAKLESKADNYKFSLTQLAAEVQDEDQAIWCGTWNGNIVVNSSTVGVLEKKHTETCPTESQVNYVLDVNGTEIDASNITTLMQSLSEYFDQVDEPIVPAG